MSRQWVYLGLSLAGACSALLLCLSCANSNQLEVPAGKNDTMRNDEKLKNALGGEKRFLTFISTDKPIYKIGEKVYVKGVILNARSHQPLGDKETARPHIQVTGPKGDVIASGTSSLKESVWAFSWDVPEGQAGGEYKVKVTYPYDGYTPAERKFDIRAYRAPRLKSQLTFMRDGYAPGDKVTATLEVHRAEGGAPLGAKVNVNAVVDGMSVSGASSSVDKDGLATISFDLPNNIPRGEGTLALAIEDGGVIETSSKTIPILLQTVDLQIYPEGGDLLSGFSNRVYLQAKQPNGKPADLSGKIICENDNSKAGEFKTEHEGRGRFEFTPQSGKDYYLSIDQPSGIKTKFKLPAVKSAGALIKADKEVYAKSGPVNVHVGCSEKKFRVSISKKEQELGAKLVEQKENALHLLSFDLPDDVDGVLTLTVWDEHDQPFAERLIFRQAAHPLKISLKAQKDQYVPGDEAKVTIKATDDKGKPVSAIVGLTVTDDSVLEMVEKRDQAPRLPVMVFLEPEVDDLADAHIYLDESNPKAALATDLLLGTQGWRRFALKNLTEFIANNGDKGRRAVALSVISRVEEEMAWAEERAAVPPGAVLALNANAMPRGAFKAAPVPMPMAAPQAVRGHMNEPVKAELVAQLAEPKEKAKLALDEEGFAGRDLKQAAPRKDADAAGNEMQDALMIADKRSRRQLIAGGDAGAGIAFMPQRPNDFVIVREFAHKNRENRQANDRRDFTETVYWNAGVKTDATTGEANISFALNDSVTSFKMIADGFSSNGELGSASTSIESVRPFYTEAKLPLEVTAGDQILLPISLVNAGANDLANVGVNVNLTGDFKLMELQRKASSLKANERQRWIQPINVGFGNGNKEFVLDSQAGQFTDKVTRKLLVKPKGFPIEVPCSGILEAGKPAVHTINIPAQVVTDSIACSTAVYPTPLANLTEALGRLIQDPYGCFEQTSSTSYPLTMAQQYFVSHTGVDPKLVQASKEKLDSGYKRLVSFWCPDKGYEWFGENPGHEALTAFGIMHFSDMSQVRDVDKNMISSTREWLLKQKDGKGGFNRKRRALHSWIEDKDCSDAYITWALLESGQTPDTLKEELDHVKAAATTSKNSYVKALAANAMVRAGDSKSAATLLDELARKQKADGSVDGITASIVGSGGDSLVIEGTSLATLAWLSDPKYAGNVERSIKYLADSCQSGRYGSTQATVLALKAIVQYDKSRARPKADGKVRVFVDNHPVGDWIDFTPKTQGAIKLPDISELLTPGEHKLELRMEGGGAMPYSMSVNYNTSLPNSSKDCKLAVDVKLASNKLEEGSATVANVVVQNKTNDVIPTPVAIIGLPGGLEPRHDQLKELVKKGTIAAYEVLGREVVLYWRDLDANARVEIPVSLIAAIPGKYKGPASRAYLYYTDENKTWVDGLDVEIAAK